MSASLREKKKSLEKMKSSDNVSNIFINVYKYSIQIFLNLLFKKTNTVLIICNLSIMLKIGNVFRKNVSRA